MNIAFRPLLASLSHVEFLGRNLRALHIQPPAPSPASFRGGQNVWKPTDVMALECAGWSSPLAPLQRNWSACAEPVEAGKPEPRAGVFQCGTGHVDPDVLSALKPPGEEPGSPVGWGLGGLRPSGRILLH